jgi:hypothetical protein
MLWKLLFPVTIAIAKRHNSSCNGNSQLLFLSADDRRDRRSIEALKWRLKLTVRFENE